MAALLAGGCGDDGGDGGDRPGPETKRTTAAAFITCFETPGFEATRPEPREEFIGYGDEENGPAVGPAIDACIE
jgi:hypothetical protein